MKLTFGMVFGGFQTESFLKISLTMFCLLVIVRVIEFYR